MKPKTTSLELRIATQTMPGEKFAFVGGMRSDEQSVCCGYYGVKFESGNIPAEDVLASIRAAGKDPVWNAAVDLLRAVDDGNELMSDITINAIQAVIGAARDSISTEESVDERAGS